MTVPIITGRVIGAEEVIRQHFGGTAQNKVIVRTRSAIRQAGYLVQRYAVTQKLAGQVLNKRTGRLQRSVNTRFDESAGRFVASVGTSLVYGRFWELGFSGVEHVRSFTRRVRGRDLRSSLRKGHGRALGVGYVRAHDRRVNQQPRPWLRPSLIELRPRIRQLLYAALHGERA